MKKLLIGGLAAVSAYSVFAVTVVLDKSLIDEDNPEGTATLSYTEKASGETTVTTFTAKATPKKGYYFAGWLGDAPSLGDAESFRGDYGLDYRTASLSKIKVPADLEEAGEAITLKPLFLAQDEDYIGDAGSGIAVLEADDVDPEMDLFKGEALEDADMPEIQSGSIPTLSWSGLPTGIKFNAKTMKFTGKPTKAGPFYPVLTVKNASGYTASTVVPMYVYSEPNAVNGYSSWNGFEDRITGGYNYQYIFGEFTDMYEDYLNAYLPDFLRLVSYKFTVSGLASGLKLVYYDRETYPVITSGDNKVYADSGYMIAGTPTKVGVSLATPKWVVTYQNTAGKQVTKTITFKNALPTGAQYAGSFYFYTLDPYGAAKSITKSGIYASGATVKLTATMNKGYQFKSWITDDDSITQNPYSDTGYNLYQNYNRWYWLNAYASPKVILVQNFDFRDGYATTNEVSNAYGVKVSGYGQYDAGKKVTLKATAKSGYVFAGWIWGDAANITLSADYRSPTVSFTMPKVEEDIVINAWWARANDSRTEDAVEIMAGGQDVCWGEEGHYEGYTNACVVTNIPVRAGMDKDDWIRDQMRNISSSLFFEGGVPYTDYGAVYQILSARWDAMTVAADGTRYYTVTNNYVTDYRALPRPDWQAITNGSTYVAAVGVAMPNVGFKVKSTTLPTVTCKGLPTGVKLQLTDPSNGEWNFTGVPTKAGAYKVTVSVKNAEKQTDTLAFTMKTVAIPEWAIGTFNGMALRAKDIQDAMYKDYTAENITNGVIDVASAALHGAANVTATIKNTGAIAGTITYKGKAYKFSTASFSEACLQDTKWITGAYKSASAYEFFDEVDDAKFNADEEVLAENVKVTAAKLADLIAQTNALTALAVSNETRWAEIEDNNYYFITQKMAHDHDQIPDELKNSVAKNQYGMWIYANTSEQYNRPWYQIPQSQVYCNRCKVAIKEVQDYWGYCLDQDEITSSPTCGEVNKRISDYIFVDSDDIYDHGGPAIDNGGSYTEGYYCLVNRIRMYTELLRRAQEGYAKFVHEQKQHYWYDEDCYETVEPFVENYSFDATVKIDGEDVTFRFELTEFNKAFNKALDKVAYELMSQKVYEDAYAEVEYLFTRDWEDRGKAALLYRLSDIYEEYYDALYYGEYLDGSMTKEERQVAERLVGDGLACDEYVQNYMSTSSYWTVQKQQYTNVEWVIKRGGIGYDAATAAAYTNYYLGAERQAEEAVRMYALRMQTTWEYTNAWAQAEFGVNGEAEGWTKGQTIGAIMPYDAEGAFRRLVDELIRYYFDDGDYYRDGYRSSSPLRRILEKLQDANLGVAFQNINNKGYNMKAIVPTLKTEFIEDVDTINDALNSKYAEFITPFIEKFIPDWQNATFTFKSLSNDGVAVFGAKSNGSATDLKKQKYSATLKGTIQPAFPITKELVEKFMVFLSESDKKEMAKYFDIDTGRLLIKAGTSFSGTVLKQDIDLVLYGTQLLMPLSGTANGDYGCALMPVFKPNGRSEIYSLGKIIKLLNALVDGELLEKEID